MRELSADVKAQLLTECAGIRTAMRRGRLINTLAEFIEWEREFGPYRTGRNRVELCKKLAARFGVSYSEVEHRLPWFADVPDTVA